LRLVLAVAPVHETVVVSATRTDAPADQVGVSVTAFTAADLERRQIPLVADLLRLSPGVMVVRSGGPGALTSLFVRGGESNHNKVLLDGIPLNEPGSTLNCSNLTTDNLERVEIVRGALSALFGSDAMASVVQLVTKRPDRSRTRPQGTFSIEGGTYGTVRGSAAASGASGKVDYAIGAQRFSTDNREPNNAFENTTLSANVGVAAGDTATIRFIARGEREHAGPAGPDGIRTAGPRRLFRAARWRGRPVVRSSGARPFPAARSVLADRVQPAVGESGCRSAVRAAVRRARGALRAGIMPAIRATGAFPQPARPAGISSQSSSIDNLAGAEYMEALGYPALGRTIRAGVRVGF
jgi:outer membrane receptor protein involved in Fe transport